MRLGVALAVAAALLATLAGAMQFVAPSASAITPTVTPTNTATPTPSGATPTPVTTPVPDSVISSLPAVTPTAPAFALLDCDTLTPGIQDVCTYSTSATRIDVALVVVNNSGAPDTICCFNFGLHNPDLTRLVPPPGADANFDANPDRADLAAGPWFCTPPPPEHLNGGPLGSDGPGTSVSFLSCFTPLSGPPIANGEAVKLATTHYDVPGSVQPGSVTLDASFLYVGNNVGNGLFDALDCLDRYDPGCPSVTIIFVAPGVEKIPEGNANNVDLDVPAANLWICESGPCDGAGEGELIVFEYATNVHTGDQNGDAVADGLGAYEFSVEYDNFVIQSLIPQDVVFNPGPIAPYPGGADGVLDGEGAARAPAACDMSIFTENIVHFGCVSAGQTAGPTGDLDLARLILVPHEDLADDLFPGNDNGTVTIVKDNGCELVDVFGHPVSGSVNGGLTPVCGNLSVTVRILEGDLNLDCVVDVEDAQLIGFRYGSFFGSLLYGTWYDLEPALHDLDIDIKDVQKVQGRNGSTCQEPIPPQPPVPFAG
jgi:hypothetical protein